MTRYKNILSERLGDREVETIVAEISGDVVKKSEIYSLMKDNNKRLAGNAAWVLTHLSTEEVEFMQGKQDELIETVMKEKESDTLRRLTLKILNRQTFDQETLRGDFIDYCLETMMAVREPLGIRSLCIKLAYKQCVLIPELETEFKQYIEILSQGEMPPAIRSSVKQVKEAKTTHRK